MPLPRMVGYRSHAQREDMDLYPTPALYPTPCSYTPRSISYLLPWTDRLLVKTLLFPNFVCGFQENGFKFQITKFRFNGKLWIMFFYVDLMCCNLCKNRKQKWNFWQWTSWNTCAIFSKYSNWIKSDHENAINMPWYLARKWNLWRL